MRISKSALGNDKVIYLDDREFSIIYSGLCMMDIHTTYHSEELMPMIKVMEDAANMPKGNRYRKNEEEEELDENS